MADGQWRADISHTSWLACLGAVLACAAGCSGGLTQRAWLACGLRSCLSAAAADPALATSVRTHKHAQSVMQIERLLVLRADNVHTHGGSALLTAALASTC